MPRTARSSSARSRDSNLPRSSSPAPARSRGFRKLAALIGAALVFIVASGCKADVDVAFEIEADGSGELSVRLELDDAAASRVGDLREEVEADDLRRAGWTVVFGVPVRGDVRSVTATRPFASSEDANAALASLTGADGPLRDLRVEQTRSPVMTRTRLRGSIDLRSGLAAFGDDRLAQLTGTRAGLPAEQLQAIPADALDLTVRAELAGAGRPSTWRALPGRRVPVAAAATSSNVRGVVSLLIAVASASALVAGLVRRRRST